MPIDPRYLDVPGVPAGGTFGCLPRDTVYGASGPRFRDHFDVIPRSQWRDILEARQTPLSNLVRKIKNQRNEGTCASNATCQAAEIAWNRTAGLKNWVEFSPISIYRWIARGPMSGSTMTGNLRQLRSVGMLPVNSESNRAFLTRAGLPSDHVLAEVGYSQRFPDGWQSTAKHFVCLEHFDIDGFDEFITALLMGFAVAYGRAGHAICGCDPVFDNNQWAVRYANSWGNWGDNGYGYDSEAYLKRTGGSYGAFAIRAVLMTNQTFQALQ